MDKIGGLRENLQNQKRAISAALRRLPPEYCGDFFEAVSQDVDKNDGNAKVVSVAPVKKSDRFNPVSV